MSAWAASRRFSVKSIVGVAALGLESFYLFTFFLLVVDFYLSLLFFTFTQVLLVDNYFLPPPSLCAIYFSAFCSSNFSFISSPSLLKERGIFSVITKRD